MRNNMKKIIAGVFAIFVWFSVLSGGFVSTVKAEDPISWESDSSLPSEPGSYILQEDITLATGTWNVNGEISIDLNGKSITSEYNTVIIVVGYGSTLSIYGDTSSIIGHDEKAEADGIKVDGGTLNLYGGTIKNNNSGINVVSGTVVLGNDTSYPEIINNTFGIYTPSTSTSDITIKKANISDNDKAFNINGSNSITMHDGAVDGGVYLENSNASFTILKGVVSGTNSFTSDNNVHPTINIGSTAGPTNEIFIKGTIKFNSTSDKLTIYDGYFDSDAYNSIKDNNFFYPGRLFVDSDKQGYAKKVAIDDQRRSVLTEKDELYGKAYNFDKSHGTALINDTITITINILKADYAMRELIVKTSSGKLIESTTTDGVHYTFTMPGESVSVRADVRQYKRVRFELAHATSDFDKPVIFPGDEVTFTLTPDDESYEKCYVLSDDVTLVQDSSDANTYTFTVPNKDVLVKGAYLLHNHEHDGVVFYIWDQSDSVPAIAGSYALGSDLTLNKNWDQIGNFDLCLNGHTIYAKSAILHDGQGEVLNLYDCQDTGKIEGQGSDLAISATRGTVNMYGGMISGFSKILSTGNGQFNIYKGTVSANDKVVSLGHFATLTIGSETDSDPSSVFIDGRFEYGGDAYIKLYSGFYDDRAHRTLGFYGENHYVVGEDRGFMPSGRSDKYTYTIGDIKQYRIIVENALNGQVIPSKDSASQKTVISLQITPDEHYELDTLTVTDKDENEIDVSDEYTFVMPTSDVTVTATFKEKNYTITFYDEDGTTVLQTVEVPYNERPSYTGDTPTKPEDVQYTYTFNGWTPTITHVTEDTSYKAEYTATARLYTVEFKNEDTVLQSTDVEYGQYPSYTGPEPVKGDKVFVGWEPEISKVEGPQTYTAKFDEQAPTLCTITFIYNGDVVTTTQYDVGTQIAIPDVPPVIANEQYQLQFREWSPTVEDGDEVSIDMTYVAQFDKIPQQYTIKWFNENELLDEQVLDYGTAIVYTGAVPTKLSTEQYDYVFNGVWTADGVQRFDVVRKNTDLYAVFDEVLRTYTVTFYDEDGTELEKDENVQYGKKASYGGEELNPDMNFAGWYTSDDPKDNWDLNDPVTSNLDLTAHYYPASTASKINGKDVMVAKKNLEGETVNNLYNDLPLVIKTNNGIIVIPANMEVDVTIPKISNEDKDNVLSAMDGIERALNMNKDCMYGIYLDVEHTKTIDPTIEQEDTKQGYIEVENSGFTAQFKEIYNNSGNTRHYDYPGRVTLTIDLDKMDIVLEEPSATMRRSFYAGHNYEADKVEYLPMTISADKTKADISVSTLSPFDIVYKDTPKPKPPTPTYNVPKTGD